MFSMLGQIVRRGWFLLLAAWLLLVLGIRSAAPPWEEVAQDREFAFLPTDAPSRAAAEVFARAFPDDHLESNVVLVIDRRQAPPDTLERDLKFVQTVLEPGLRAIAEAEGGLASQAPSADEPLFADEPKPAPTTTKRSVIARIRTPNAAGSGPLLVSEDRQVLLVVLELTTEFLSSANWPTLNRIERLVSDLRQQDKLPQGVDIAVTGSAVIGRDQTVAQVGSAKAAEQWTFILVIGLLIAIYRAPLLAIIPLITVFLAIQVTRNLLAILGNAGYLTLFQGIEIYITILAYGAGVDYCLFLTARYKEELDHGRDAAEAVEVAIREIGAPLVASALTVVCGIGMMVFAQFGKFREAGLAIPMSILFVLSATLTFTPALLRLAGRWAFWPWGQRRVRPAAAMTGDAAGSRMAFLERGWDWMGHFLERRAGLAWLVTVACMAPFALVAGWQSQQLSYNLIGALPATAPSVIGTRILQDHFPSGILGPVNVLVVNPHLDFSRPEGRALVTRITGELRGQAGDLGVADIRSLTEPLGVTPAAERALASLPVPPERRQEAAEAGGRERYLTSLGERNDIGTRLDLILQSGPFDARSVDSLDRVEQALHAAIPPEHQADTLLYIDGPSASVRDLQHVVRQDRARIEVLVLAGVFVILVLLLRELIVPVYLLLSVLFSYYVTLGVTMGVFWLADPQGFTGLDWRVAIFLFTILIAVGEDYNIFLMSRIHEEQRRHGAIRGITVALDRTGPIISSCGLIMAGTFASLLGASLNDMRQLGFALAFGVLLDTFVVRPILVPAFLILLERSRNVAGAGKRDFEGANPSMASQLRSHIQTGSAGPMQSHSS